jgi:hypothetical protein
MHLQILYVCVCVCVCVCTQGLTLASLETVHWSHAHSLFCFSYFLISLLPLLGGGLWTLILLSPPPKWVEFQAEVNMPSSYIHFIIYFLVAWGFELRASH